MQQNGFYKIKELNKEEIKILKEILVDVNFSALNFTDSRNQYQFYPLKRLWSDIQIALENDVNIVIPGKNIIELEKILSDEEDVEIHIFNNKILFKYKNLVFQSNLLSGTYPNTTNLIPIVLYEYITSKSL